ncbi:MAG: hypothetical protein U0640_00320 [Phycisphaerales bacterium]
MDRLTKMQTWMPGGVRNIESLLTALDSMIDLDSNALMSVDEANKARSSLLRLLEGVLNCTMRLSETHRISIESTANHLRFCRNELIANTLKPAGYADIAAIVGQMWLRYGVSNCASIVTFNYDLGMEIAIGGSDDSAYVYGLTEDKRANSSEFSLPIYKVHGSMNWFRNSEKKVVSDRALTRAFIDRFFSSPGHCFPTPEHCPLLRPAGEEPVIVPPSHHKYSAMGMVVEARRGAARAIQSADVIVFCGYSLPPADSWFRNLLGLTLPPLGKLRRILVINPAVEAHQEISRFVGPAYESVIQNCPLGDMSTLFGQFERLCAGRDACIGW